MKSKTKLTHLQKRAYKDDKKNSHLAYSDIFWMALMVFFSYLLG